MLFNSLIMYFSVVLSVYRTCMNILYINMDVLSVKVGSVVGECIGLFFV